MTNAEATVRSPNEQINVPAKVILLFFGSSLEGSALSKAETRSAAKAGPKPAIIFTRETIERSAPPMSGAVYHPVHEIRKAKAKKATNG